MGIASAQDEFLLAADEWLCNNYALDIRYIARPTADPYAAKIICASISMSPVKSSIENSFSLTTKNITAGQKQKYPVGKEELKDILKNAIQGKIELPFLNLEIHALTGFDYYSEQIHKNSWFSDLHLQIDCNSNVGSLFSISSKVDNELRLSDPPFDGMFDLASWLGFDRLMNNEIATIVIRISPPVALVFDSCGLQNDHLILSVEAHEEIDPAQVGIAIRGVPGNGVASRMQVANLISWSEAAGGVRHGVTNINIKNCDSAFAMLMIGSSTVRRQWFLDATKARNNRYMAIQNFDIELRQIRRALFELNDADKFEKGIAALFFMLGFSPMLQVETDAPDLIVTTPGGQLVLIECTIKISDFSEKMGKLVDRRGALSKSLSDAGHPSNIMAMLICRSAKDQIAIREDELNTYKVSLFTKNEIDHLFNGIRNPNDPDKIINDLKERFENTSSGFI